MTVDFAQGDNRSLDELFAAATDRNFQGEDGHWGDWTAVMTLQLRATREILERALKLTASEEPHLCERGVDILSQLGAPDRAFPEECFNTVVDLIQRRTEPEVLAASAYALGHLRDMRAAPYLVSLHKHPHEDVRHAVAFAVGGHNDPTAATALIALMSDEDEDVRNWATFSLGIQCDMDSPAIREALFQRLDDLHDETRFEGLRSLANREDTRIPGKLIEELQRGDWDIEEEVCNFLGIEYARNSLSSADLIAELERWIAAQPEEPLPTRP